MKLDSEKVMGIIAAEGTLEGSAWIQAIQSPAATLIEIYGISR